MSSLFSVPYLLAAGVYASMFLFVLLLIFGLFGKVTGSRWSAVALVLSISVVALVLFVGDWKIPSCYDGEGNLMSELPQCHF